MAPYFIVTDTSQLGISLPVRPWDGSHVVVPITKAQLAALLAESLEEDRDDDLFSLSPLTSPDPTPPPSRPSSPGVNHADLAPPASPVNLTGYDSTPPSSRPSSPGVSHADLAPPRTQPSSPVNLTGYDSTPPSSRSPSPSGDQVRRKRRAKAQGHGRRKLQRAANQAAAFGDAAVPVGAQEKYTKSAEPIYTALHTAYSKVTATAFTGLNVSPIDTKRAYTLEELVGENARHRLALRDWDGRYAH